jgi:hypothetical protein
VTAETAETPRRTRKEGIMIVLGVVLLVLGVLLKVGILWTLGIIGIVVGAILALFGAVGRPVGGRAYWW